MQHAIVLAARLSSSIFVDGFFGYESQPFQRHWHEEWQRPAAQVVQWSPIEHGKTQQVTGNVLHGLGVDPVNSRVLWIGSTETEAKKSAGIVKRAIEAPSPFLRAVFPGLRPARGRAQKWTEAEFNVEGINVLEKDRSLRCAGVGGEILGGRYTKILLDDVCTFETTYTKDRRDKFKSWFFSTVVGRLVEGARVICTGNAWYPDDLMHALAERGFTVIRNEGYREDDAGHIVPESILWPQQWSLQRLIKRRSDFGGPGSVEAQRQLRCVPYSPGQGRFEMDWFDKAMERGRGVTFQAEYHGPWPTFMGVDLGVQQTEGHDSTAFWCMAVDIYGSGDRLPLDMFEERIPGPTTVKRLKEWKRRFGPVIMVENNAAQDFIRQFASADGVETRAFTTGKNKANPDFGIPSLGVELQQGKWILPTGSGERSREYEFAVRWRTQCLNWTPGQHTGDLLMSSWFAREAARGSSGEVAFPPQGTEQTSAWKAPAGDTAVEDDDETDRPSSGGRSSPFRFNQ